MTCTGEREREIGAIRESRACMRTVLANGFLCALEADVRNLVVSKVCVSFLLSSEAVINHDMDQRPWGRGGEGGYSAHERGGDAR